MTVQARFYVSEVTRQAYNTEHLKVTLTAVSRGDQNAQWSEATPSGKIEMTINNPPAAKQFEEMLSKDVAVTFEFLEKVESPKDGHPFRQSTAPENTYYGTPGKCGDCGYMREEHSLSA